MSVYRPIKSVQRGNSNYQIQFQLHFRVRLGRVRYGTDRLSDRCLRSLTHIDIVAYRIIDSLFFCLYFFLCICIVNYQLTYRLSLNYHIQVHSNRNRNNRKKKRETGRRGARERDMLEYIGNDYVQSSID